MEHTESKLTGLRVSGATEASESFTSLEESVVRRRINASNSSSSTRGSSSMMGSSRSVCSPKSRGSFTLGSTSDVIWRIFNEHRSSLLTVILFTSFFITILLQESPKQRGEKRTHHDSSSGVATILDDTSDSIRMTQGLSISENNHLNNVLGSDIMNESNKNNHKIWVFGYGSLLNEDSLRRTIGDHNNQNNPHFYPVRITHLIREWTADFYTLRDGTKSRSTAVAVRETTDRNSYTTGVIFQTDYHGIRELVKREIPYNLKELPLNHVTFVNKDGSAMISDQQSNLLKSNHIDKIFTFVIKAETLKLVRSASKYERNPIDLTYLDICLSGSFRFGGETFAREFISTTLGWDKVHLRNNRGSPNHDHVRNEWSKVTQQELTLIDKLLSQAGIKPDLSVTDS